MGHRGKRRQFGIYICISLSLFTHARRTTPFPVHQRSWVHSFAQAMYQASWAI